MIDVLAGYWPSFVAFCIFGLLHSLGAREPFKAALAKWTSAFFVVHFWRLFYFALSFYGYFYILGPLHWGLHPNGEESLFYYPDDLWPVVTFIHLCSVAILYVAFLQSDYLGFIGVRQAWQGIKALVGFPGHSTPLDLFGTNRLETHGIYGWVRHPMLAGGLLFLLTTDPTLNTVIFTVMYATYMLVGGYYEELRLISIFGEAYRDYQKKVPAYVPYLHLGLPS